MIGSSDIYGAVLVVAILLLVLSIPSIVLTVNASSKMLRRYRAFRSADPGDMGMDIPKVILDEWASVSTPLGYMTVLMEEMDRLGSVRPSIFQAEIAVALIVVLAVLPGYDTNVLACMSLVLALAVASIFYWHRNFGNYGREYYDVVRELESNGNDAEDMIYG